MMGRWGVDASSADSLGFRRLLPGCGFGLSILGIVISALLLFTFYRGNFIIQSGNFICQTGQLPGEALNVPAPDLQSFLSATWVEINRTQLLANAVLVRTEYIDKKVVAMAMVKGNAYGYGLDLAAGVFKEAGWDEFGVAEPQEALRLRKLGYQENITLIYQSPYHALDNLAQFAVDYNIQLTVEDESFVRGLCSSLEKMDRPTQVMVHLAVSTGKVREGARLWDAMRVAEAVAGCPKLRLRSVFTHHGDAGKIQEFAAEVRSKGIPVELVHAGCSNHVREPQVHLDLVRMGSVVYLALPWYGIPVLKCALKWYTRVASIKKVYEGERIGYKEKVAVRDYTVAVLNTGYYDHSDISEVQIRDTLCPLIEPGTSMNLNLVDVSSIADQVAIGDVVTLSDVNSNLFGVKMGNTGAIPPHIPRVVIA